MQERQKVQGEGLISIMLLCPENLEQNDLKEQ